jgi:hypothetical protein
MSRRDELMLVEAYNSVLSDRALLLWEQQLEDEKNFLIQEGFIDSVKGAVGGAVDTVTGAVGGAVDTVKAIPQLPDKLSQYFNQSLPEFFDKLGDYFQFVLISGASGMLITNVVGRLLVIAAKRMRKEADTNAEIVMNMVPSMAQEKIAKIESLKESNPREYQRAVFEINKEVQSSLFKTLSDKKLKPGIKEKILEHVGTFLQNPTVSLVGGILIAWLIQQIGGVNPLPSVPSLEN